MTDDRTRIMVVDDDGGMRVTIQGIIEDEGYDVSCAEDGYQAIELAAQSPFPLVFLDIKMPGKSGLEVLEELRAHHPDTAVVMVTVVEDVKASVKALKLGAYDYIVKPFRVDDILLSLRRALELRRLTLENRDYQLKLGKKVAEQTEHLEQKIRELTALNELFQSYLNQRYTTEAAYGRLAVGVMKMAQETETLAEEVEARRAQLQFPDMET